MEIHTFSTLPSTNQYCELLDLREVEEFAVFRAVAQTAGVGQRGNRWTSDAGKNLTFSLILHPKTLPIPDQYQLTKVVSLGIVDTLGTLLSGNHDIQIKWPNDIYVGDNKICGILISHKVRYDLLADTIVGIGMNVNQTVFPDWVPNPTSLRQLMDKEWNLDEVLGSMIVGIKNRYDAMIKDISSPDDEYLSLLLNYGVQSRYIYHDEEIDATIHGINRFGHLLLTTAQGVELCCQMKEITFCVSNDASSR